MAGVTVKPFAVSVSYYNGVDPTLAALQAKIVAIHGLVPEALAPFPEAIHPRLVCVCVFLLYSVQLGGQRSPLSTTWELRS